MTLLPAYWETTRLRIQSSQLTELERLREVFNACAYVGQWDKTFQVVSEEEMIEVVEQSLGVRGNENGRFRMYSVYWKEPNQIVAYFHLTTGAPKPHITWISMFVVHPDYQKHQFGQEITNSLWAELEKLEEITAVWLDVYLTNWPALRFWLLNGFNTILDYDGDKICQPGAYANIALEKKLRVNRLT